MTEELSRTSALASRHTELGSGLEDWNGMGTAWSYNTNPEDEHDAVRERCGMFDMSPLKKVLVEGRDAASVLNHLTTRDISKIVPGQASYLSVLTEKGTVADDAIVYNQGDDKWMIVHGSGNTMELLGESANGKSVTTTFTDDLHDISVQGPNSLSILQAASDFDLSKLKYFEHTEVQIFGHSCLVSRTGYSGERGYEIFAHKSVVGNVWDSLVEAGVMPCSFTSLDKVRIEAGLLFYGYDMTEEHTPYEVGLGFTIAKGKTGYRGCEALQQAKGNESIANVCLDIDHPEMLVGGEKLVVDGREVGVINSPCYSHRLGKSLALAHVEPAYSTHSTSLVVIGDNVDCYAVVSAMPIYDTKKERTHQH